MRQLAQICAETPILQQVVAQLPWGHTITLIEKLKVDNERLWKTGVEPPTMLYTATALAGILLDTIKDRDTYFCEVSRFVLLNFGLKNGARGDSINTLLLCFY